LHRPGPYKWNRASGRSKVRSHRTQLHCRWRWDPGDIWI